MNINNKVKFYLKVISFFLAILLIYFYGSYIFTNKSGTIRTLTGMGYSSIKITGYRFFACGQDDIVSTGFVAVDNKGNKVSGVSCEGLVFKYRTIRFD